MPITCIKLKKYGKSKKFSSTQCIGLLHSIYLSVNSQVMLARNEWVSVGLSNRSTRIFKDIIFNDF